MDAYLSAAAFKYLTALGKLELGCRGWLLGHMRGHRYIIEQVFPAPGKTNISLDKLLALDDELDNGLIGFFVFEPDAEPDGMEYTPFAVGKVLLKISSAPDGGLDVVSSRIEYAGEYQLTTLPLIIEKQVI